MARPYAQDALHPPSHQQSGLPIVPACTPSPKSSGGRGQASSLRWDTWQKAVRALLGPEAGPQQWLFDRRGEAWRLLGKPSLTYSPSPVHCKVFSIPGFYELDASSIPSPICDN